MTTGSPERGGSSPDRSTVADRLRVAGCVAAEEEAELLLTSIDRSSGPDGLEAAIRRREAGEPLEHIVGWAAFAGLRIPVGPGVFVPRPRTERLATEALRLTPDRGTAVELCCGAAAVSAVLLTARPGLDLHAADLDPAAVEAARRTVAAFGGDPTRVHHGDLFDALPPDLRGTLDLVVANVPYVPTAELDLLPAEARLHEPALALDGGSDGLTVARRLLRGARSWLRPGGVALFEVGVHQVDAARAVDEFGLDLVAGAEASDDEGRPEVAVIVARRRGPTRS